MLHSNKPDERENLKKRQAALQTKTQKRWRMNGSHLNALVSEYEQGTLTSLEDWEEWAK